MAGLNLFPFLLLSALTPTRFSKKGRGMEEGSERYFNSFDTDNTDENGL